MIRTTKTKIFIAKIIYKVIKVFIRNDIQVVERNGIKLELDLKEGIELSLFLFGNFQKHITENKVMNIKKDSIIFDVGGNNGAISLLFAKQVTNGKVYSFEPTEYALKKFNRNLELNPSLAKRIVLTNAFMSSKNEDSSDIIAYSSWPVNSNKDEKHEVHGGIAKQAIDVPSFTMDTFCKNNQINQLDFIKIDTDGHEFEVLQGAKETLQSLKPIIIFEIGLYIMEEMNLKFEDYYNYFSSLHYSVCTVHGKDVNLSNYRTYILENGTVDLIAKPS